MHEFSLKIMPLYLAFHLLFTTFLIIRVIKLRRKEQVGIGFNDKNTPLARAVRVHGNYIENMPLFMILLASLELLGSPVWMLHSFGILFTLSRLLHMQGLGHTIGKSQGRVVGMLGTFACFIFGALALVYFALVG